MQPGDGNGATYSGYEPDAGALAVDGSNAQIVAVPRQSPAAFIGPAIGIAAFVAALIHPLALAVVAGGAAVYAATDLIRALDARAVVVPRAFVLVVIGLVPIAAYKGPAAAGLATIGAVFAILVWGLAKVSEPGLADSLAGAALAIAVVAFGLANATLISVGEFRGGPVSAKWVMAMTLLMIAFSQILAGIFSAATVNIGGGRAANGSLAGVGVALVLAVIFATLKHPPVSFGRYLLFGLIVGAASAAGRAIAGMFLSGASDPEEIVDPGLIGHGYGLQSMGAALIAFPAAFYVARWLFV